MSHDPFANVRNPAVAQPASVDYQPHHLRIECIYMALRVPDGCAPPPLDEVMARAERYWRFIAG